MNSKGVNISFSSHTENQFCGGKLTKLQGSVKTPNWPDSNYPAGISCSWHISVATNMVSMYSTVEGHFTPFSFCSPTISLQ